MHLAVRADGGPEIGFGHLVRTGAVAAEGLDRGDDVTYLTRTPDAAETVCPAGVDVVMLPDEDRATELAAVSDWIESHDPGVVLIDSYDADADYQARLRDAATATAVILDDTRFSICADYLINGNVYAPELDYDVRGPEPATCLGLSYLPVRAAIRRAAADPAPFRPDPERAVVTMGGSDIGGTTPTVCRAFDGGEVTVDVIVGPGVDDDREIRRAIDDTDADLRRHDDPDDFAALIARADLAVGAAGSTTYELLAVGTPTIAIPQAPNQEPIVRALADREAVVRLDPDDLNELPARIDGLLSDADRRRDLRRRGRDLVDCRGAQRVYRRLADAEA